jgi:hypothetical protein
MDRVVAFIAFLLIGVGGGLMGAAAYKMAQFDAHQRCLSQPWLDTSNGC